MKNTFKKMAASIMAVASLAVSAFGINANAVVDTDGTGKVETYSGTIIGTSALSVTSTSATGVTYASSYHEIEEYDGTVGTGTLTVYR